MFNKKKELSPREIWIRIRFLEINGSPSLIIIFLDKQSNGCTIIIFVNVR